jgi:hypothetical protein
MDDILLLEAIERYLKDELSAEERAYFEDLRKNNPEIDQLVVEHSMFLHQINAFGQNRQFRHKLHEVHNDLVSKGDIKEGLPGTTKGRVVLLWKKYKRVTGIAATIAGLTALVISGLVTYFTPANTHDELRN